MRFMVYRARTKEWLDRDLQGVHEVAIAEVLSGPARLSFTIAPEARQTLASDGLRVLEDWGSIVVAVDEDSWAIQGYGIVVPPTEWEDENHVVTCLGVCGYVQGFIYEDAKNWGPKTDSKGNVTKPRPDPLAIVKDLWIYAQSFPNSDLGVTVKYQGKSSSTARVGTIEEPYRLRWWESPDIGAEIDSLAADTPFDYRERAYWKDDTHQEVRFEVIFGWPRLGKSREDLAFQLGVNVMLPPSPHTAEDFANTFLGIGNGEGAQMTTARYAVDDGRLRRTLVYTDKTVKDPDRLHKRLILSAASMTSREEFTEVAIRDHPDARISDINVGDDLLIDTFVPAFGDLRQWVRVVEKARGDDEYRAVLAVEPADNFLYNPATPSDLEPSYSLVTAPKFVINGCGPNANPATGIVLGTDVAIGDLVFVTVHVGEVSDPRFTLVREQETHMSQYGSWLRIYAGTLTDTSPIGVSSQTTGEYAWVAVRDAVMGPRSETGSVGTYEGNEVFPWPYKDIPAPGEKHLAVTMVSVQQSVTAGNIGTADGWLKSPCGDSSAAFISTVDPVKDFRLTGSFVGWNAVTIDLIPKAAPGTMVYIGDGAVIPEPPQVEVLTNFRWPGKSSSDWFRRWRIVFPGADLSGWNCALFLTDPGAETSRVWDLGSQHASYTSWGPAQEWETLGGYYVAGDVGAGETSPPPLETLVGILLYQPTGTNAERVMSIPGDPTTTGVAGATVPGKSLWFGGHPVKSEHPWAYPLSDVIVAHTIGDTPQSLGLA